MTVSARLAPFGTSVFAEMTQLAARHQAINLAQGFPDFDGPSHVKDAAKAAIDAGHGQYARMPGVPALNQAIAQRWAADTAQAIDPDAQVTITAGCTEAIAATLLGLLNPGDEVVIFEPFYDSYRACVELAKEWRTDRALRRLEAMLIVADKDETLLLTGAGDVLEPEYPVIAVGSGGAYALAAARAVYDYSVDAETIATKAMGIAADICVYTNRNLTIETLQS